MAVIKKGRGILETKIRHLSANELKTLIKPNDNKKDGLTNLVAARIKFFGAMISGYPVTISSFIVNDSDVNCGPFTVDVDTGKGIEKVNVPGLKAKSGIEVSVTRSTDFGSPQKIEAKVKVDSDNKITESNESDNQKRANITIYPIYPPHQ